MGLILGTVTIVEGSEAIAAGVGIGEAAAAGAEAAAVGAEVGAAEATLLSAEEAAAIAEGTTAGLAEASGAFDAATEEILLSSEPLVVASEDTAAAASTTGDFAEWYAETFGSELTDIEATATEELAPLETEATTTAEEAGNAAEEAVTDIPPPVTGPGNTDLLQPPSDQVGITGFGPVPESAAEAAETAGTATAGNEVSGITGFSSEGGLPSPQQMRDIFADILRNRVSEMGPLGFTWDQVLEGLQTLGVGFLASYGIRDSGDILQAILERTAYRKIHGVSDDAKDLIYFDPNGNVIPSDRLITSNVSYIDPFRLGVTVGKLTTLSTFEFHNGDSIEISNENLMKALTKASMQYPEGSHLADKLFKYIASTEEFRSPRQADDEFTQISNVYNGDISQPFINNDGDIAIIDETGREVKNYGNHSGIVIKPIYGEYTGMYSPNVKMPVSLLDSYCFLHDQAYVERGMFDKEADLQLISRIVQNFDRFSGYEKQVAKFAAKYFSTGGQVMASFKKQKPIGQLGEQSKDLYDMLIPQDVVPITEAGLNSAGRRGRQQFRSVGKDNFYAGLSYGLAESLEEEAVAEGLGQNLGSDGRNNKALLEMFDNIPVIVSG